MENTSNRDLIKRIRELEKENKALREEVSSVKKPSSAQENIPLSKQLVKETIDSISEAIYIQDKQGLFVEVNRSAEVMYGYPREFFIGKTPEFISAPGENDLNAVKKIVQKAYEGKPQRFEFWGIDKNKRVFPKEVSLTPGTYMGQKAVIAVGRDITDSFHAKKALEERERMLDTLISNLPGMVYRCKNDEFWTMEYLSPGVKKLTGYHPDDIIKNKTIAYNDIIHPEDRNKTNDKIHKALHDKTQFTVTYRIIDARGHIKWVWEQGQGIFYKDDKPTLIEGFITDITEQKIQEEKIKEQSAKINTIISTIPDLFFVFDSKGNYVNVLANDHSKLALEPDKLIGANLAEIFSKEEASRFLKMFETCLNTGKLQTLEYSLEIDGKPMFFEARISQLDKDHVLSIVRDITKRKQNEEALLQAEENFRRTLDESPLGMRIVSDQYKTIYANQAILDIYGYESFEEYINTPIKQRYAPGSYKQFLKRRELRKKGLFVPSEYELSIVQKNGEIRHLISYRKKILWDGKKQSLVICRDVTQQKLAERALKESEARFRSIYQNSSLGMYRTTVDGKILMSNPALVKLLGYESFEELSRTRDLSKQKYFGEKSPRREFVKRMEKNHEIRGYEAEWVHKKGTIVYVRLSAKAIKDEKGRTIYYDGVVEDITKHKLAEKALEESEKKFRILVENAFDGIYLMKGSHYEYVNDKFCEISGYTREELTSPGFDFKDMLTYLESNIVEKWQNNHKKGVKSATIYETQLKTKYGKEKDVEIMTLGIELAGKMKVLGVIRDITERKQSQKLKQEVAVAKRSLEFKKNFLANMSHEIRTPLTGIIGMAEIISKTELTAFQKDYLNSLMYSTENLREIINQILDYSKIEAGEVMLKPRVFSVNSILENAHKLFESICHKRIKLEVVISNDLPEFIKTDEQRISQIVYNLLSNAVKFTDEGSIVLRIQTFTPIDSKGKFMIKMEVKDTGIGIRQAVQKQLFKPFSQVGQIDTRDYDGTGLGLSICKGLCEILGGEIGVESRPGKGSMFWFTFKAEVAKEPKPVKIEAKQNKPKVSSQLKVLHVEDKLVNQKVVSLLLKSLGCKVVTVNNGKEALEKYRQTNNFDLILMDIQMPVMDGITATNELRRRFDNLPPIIGLSANAFEGDREKYIKLGMDEYLTKPVIEEDIDRMLKCFKLK